MALLFVLSKFTLFAIAKFVILRVDAVAPVGAILTVPVPNAFALVVTEMVPALIAVVPVYPATAPDSVKVPVPIFVKPPLPFNSPLNAVLVLSVPVVNVCDKVTVPAPAKEPMLCAKLLRSKVPVTVKALALDSAFVAPACKTPALINVAPV